MKGKKKVWILSIITIGVFLLFGAGIFFAVYVARGRMYFVEGTTINGVSVANKTVNQAVEVLEEEFFERDIILMEGNQEILSQKLSSVGTIDEDTLAESVKECIQEQREHIFSSFMSAKHYEVEIPYTFSLETYQQMITDSGLLTNRTMSQDAALEFNGETYQITPEVNGNELDEAQLQELVQTQVDVQLQEENEAITIEITSDLYKKPTIFQDNEELVTKMNVWNQFCQAKIEYQFGSETEVLDWNTIQKWIIIENGNGTLNEDEVKAFVENLATEYNTIYRKRTITTSHGTEKELVSNDYGYKIDYDSEVAQLTADITSNTAVQREPIYSKRGYSRNGKDDVNGTYVEVDLTNQHLWFYKDYKLIVETDIVSGKPSYQETAQGAFSIAYKASPYNLKGGGSNGTKSWDVNVDYWMPFHDGQGLHDASWKSAFGGEIYKTNGSHGCVNLPHDAAKKIYENIEALVPIFLYK